MKIIKGQSQYPLKSCDVLAANLVLNGSLNDERAAPYQLARIEQSNMGKRYTEGSEFFNPQEGCPIYFAFSEEMLTLWPVPMEDYELKLTIQPHESALRKIAGQMLPTLNKGIREI